MCISNDKFVSTLCIGDLWDSSVIWALSNVLAPSEQQTLGTTMQDLFLGPFPVQGLLWRMKVVKVTALKGRAGLTNTAAELLRRKRWHQSHHP